MAFSNGLAAGLQAGVNLGNSINGRRDKKQRQVIDDDRYQQERDRRSKLDTEQSKARGLQMGLQQQTLDSKKKKSGVDFAADTIRDFNSGGITAVSRLFKDTKRGKELMQSFGYDEIEIQTSGENEHYILGRKGEDWGIVLQDGSYAAEDAAPDPLTDAGVITLGKHLLDVDNETFIAANSIVQKEIAAAQISKEDRAIKRTAAKGKAKGKKAGVVTRNNGELVRLSDLRAEHKAYKVEQEELGETALGQQEWINGEVTAEYQVEIQPKPPMTDEEADAEVDAWYNENASMWKSDKSQFGGLNEQQVRAKKKAELLGESIPVIEAPNKSTQSGRNKVAAQPETQNYSGLW